LSRKSVPGGRVPAHWASRHGSIGSQLLDADNAQAAKAQADAARAQAEAQARAATANKSADDANAVRERLRQQLNSVLATSETARGLIVNMSDVLFDTGKYTLKPGTQISLAKVSGILEAYPGLRVQVEGYSDSVGRTR
jgi:outer membrane protein OmpA-like peptidoglycan-associated protein